jgi:hypothetical protein
VVEFDIELSANRLVQTGFEVEVVAGGIGRYRCMKKPALAELYAAEE